MNHESVINYDIHEFHWDIVIKFKIYCSWILSEKQVTTFQFLLSTTKQQKHKRSKILSKLYDKEAVQLIHMQTNSKR